MISSDPRYPGAHPPLSSCIQTDQGPTCYFTLKIILQMHQHEPDRELPDSLVL